MRRQRMDYYVSALKAEEAANEQQEETNDPLLIPQPLTSLSMAGTHHNLTKWRDSLDKLRTFIESNDRNYPTANTNPKLRSWVQHNRRQKRDGLLSADMVKELIEFKFIWEVNENNWASKFKEWKELDDQATVDPVMKRWIQRQREYQQKWQDGKTTGGKQRKLGNDSSSAMSRRKLMQDAGFIFHIGAQQPSNEMPLGNEYSTKNSESDTIGVTMLLQASCSWNFRSSRTSRGS